MLHPELLIPLTLYTLLTAGLVAVVFVYRTVRVLLRLSAADSWPRSSPAHEPGLVQRAHDAHKNCVETFPLFLVAVLVMMSQHDTQTAWTGALSVLVAMRFLQSTIHLIGTQPALVFMRGLCFAAQLIGLAVIVSLALI